MFHELTMKDMEDREVKLSQWAGKGNYVLVDFWASWCGPCRQEMPNVIQNYERYHAKGFEVVGVSFDQKKDAWVAAVQQMGMRWPQMSDLKGWQCAASDIYGIRSIPASVLLDPQGKIIAIDLRGNALGAKLKEIYGE
jgi:thiol-disulfide isomerase/thioredoxin